VGETEVDVACRHYLCPLGPSDRKMVVVVAFFFVDYEQCVCGAGDLNFARATVKSVALT